MKKYNYGLLKMKRQTFPSYFSILAILIITLYSCQEDHIINNTAYNEGDFEAEASESVEGIIRLKLREDNINDLSISLKSGNIQSNIEGLDSILNAIGAMSFKRTFPNSGKYEERTMAKGMHLWYDISYDTCQASLAKVIGKFKNLNEVEITEPIKKIITPAYSIQKLDPVLLEHTLKSTASTSNDYPFSDPFLSYQWHYYNDGTVNDALEGCDINLFNAWLKQKGSPEVIVAVIDGGIDITHEDLATNIWVNTSEYNGSSKTDDDGNGYKDDIYGYNFVDNNGTIEPNDHGTHVAGIIGAENGNNIGLCGIAGGDVAIPGVRLMSCQVFETDAMGNETSADNFAEAIKYAADNGAVICQNSWGYDELSYLPESMKAAIDYFIEFAGIDENGVQIGPMSGGIVIFASGNESSTTNAYPAMYDPVIAVTSLSANFTMPYYSNYGSWVDIAAPGGVDSSEDYYDNWIASTVTDNEYAYLIGTSMACPHVSGVAALIVSEFGGQGFTPDMLKERLYYGAINVDIYNNNYQGMLGNGLINAAACLSELNSIPPEPVTDLTAIVDGNDISLTWTVTNDVDDLKPTGYKIYYSKNYFSTADITENNTSLSSAIQLVQLHEVGDTISLTINNLDYASNYYFRIAAYDVLGSYSEYSESLLVITAENHAPTITSNSGNSFKLKAHETYTFTCSLADQDGDSYTWNISDSAGNITTEGTTSEIIITIHGLTATPGTYQASIFIEDEFGATSDFTFNYTIQENHPPIVIKAIENTYIGDPDNTISMDLSDVFYDEDEEDLQYKLAFSASYLDASISNNILSLTPLSNGLSTLEITALDARQASASTTFQVMIRNDSMPIDIYPNPVTDLINFRMGDEIDGNIEIEFYNDKAVMVNKLSIPISTFSPASSNISNMASGQYLLKIKYNNQEFERNIIKL